MVTDNAFEQLVGHGGPLVLGEIHGTREIPELVSSLVERVAATGRPVRLCLEMAPRDVQHDLLARLSAGAVGLGWWRGLHDGRSSTAMAELIDRVWRLAASCDVACEGLQRNVFHETDIPRWERIMADRLVDTVRRNPEAFVVALVGNGHSRVDDIDCPYPTAPMAALARAELPDLRSLQIVTTGGSAWLCTDQTRPGGPTTVPALPGSENAPGIHWWPAITNHHHGIWVIGPITVSSPTAAPWPPVGRG